MRTRRSVCMLASVVTLFLSPSMVHAGGPLDSFAEAVGRVGASARAVMDKTQYGFIKEGPCLFGGMIPEGGSTGLDQQLIAGREYAFIAAGDDDALDVDIVIMDKAGTRVAADQDNEAKAVVAFSPKRDGVYSIHVVLAKCKTSLSFCTLAIMRSGGWDVPSDNMVNAAVRCVKHCNNIAQQGENVRFNRRANQWSVFGAVLNKGEDVGLTSMDLGEGRRIFAAVGDTFAQDVDLFLADPNKQILAKDEDDDNTPVFRYRVNEEHTYGVHIRNSRSEKPALVIGAILSED